MRTEESAENYLETVLLLSRKNGKVRSVDIARERGFSKPTVSIALKKLVQKGYVEINADLAVVLTQDGRRIAEKIYERHRLITQLLMKVGADEQMAEENACRIEHVITSELFAVLKKYVEEQ